MSSSKTGLARSESGFTLIDMLFVIALIGLLSTLAIPGLMRARGAAQSASALGTMKVVNSAQLSFAITCGLGFYSPEFKTLGVMPLSAVEAFLPPEMSSDLTFIKSGYTFSMAGVGLPGAPASCNGLAGRRRRRRVCPGRGSSRCHAGADAVLRNQRRRHHLRGWWELCDDHARDRCASRRRAHQVANGSGLGARRASLPTGSSVDSRGPHRQAPRPLPARPRIPNRPQLFWYRYSFSLEGEGD